MSARTRPDPGAELEHLKRYLVERARGRCRPPPGEQDQALPEFRVPMVERITQLEFSRLVKVPKKKRNDTGHIHQSTLSSVFRDINKLGDSWTGLVDALGLSIDEAIAASRKWQPPVHDDEEGTPNLRLAFETFERSEGKVGHSVRGAMIRVLHAAGDRTVDEWMKAIRYARLAEPSMPTQPPNDDGPGSKNATRITRTEDAGKPLPAHSTSPVLLTRRRGLDRR